MQKIKTLFKKDPTNLGRVINEINYEGDLADYQISRKRDGTACTFINGYFYKRYDNKKGKVMPKSAIECFGADPATGHHPYWVLCDLKDPSDKYHFEAEDNGIHSDGTHELCGPKINGNHEELDKHILIRHGDENIDLSDLTFEGIKEFLEINKIEGLVFVNDFDMYKIRRKDFGLDWPIKDKNDD